MRYALATSRRASPIAAALLVGMIAHACTDEQPSAPVLPPPSNVIRGYDPPSGCAVEGIPTNYGDSAQVLVTFSGGTEGCKPNLVEWGIDMADPLGVDTPQSNLRWDVAYDLVANSPSSPGGAGHFYTPDVAFIEFDPPVRSVEFYYSRLAMDGAVWGGQGVFADSMLVRAMS